MPEPDHDKSSKDDIPRREPSSRRLDPNVDSGSQSTRSTFALPELKPNPADRGWGFINLFARRSKK